MKLKLLICCLIFISSRLVFSQTITSPNGYLPNYDPPSPEASSLGKYIEHPVGYFTGTPVIDIPLFEIKSGRIKVPISISYHGSGIKVDEVSSRVGTGFTLNAGGVVTKTVKGWPDDWDTYNIKGYFNNNSTVASEPFGNGEMRVYDLEPDPHYYNFGAKKGTIYFSNKTTPRTTNSDPIKINGPYNGDNRFVITTEDGLIYKFGAVERISQTYGAGSYAYNSYYLTEIEDPVTTKKVIFKYRTDMPTIPYSNRKSSHGLFNCALLSGTVNYTNVTLSQVKVLEKIEFAGGYVELKADHSRQDLIGDKAYTEINLYDNENTHKKGFSLNYSYTTSGGTPEGKRLYLESIKEKGSDGSFLPGYSFFYKNRDNLPPRNSFQQDIWGFYNANNQTVESVAKVYVYQNAGKTSFLPFPQLNNNPSSILSGTERSSNPQTIDYGVLNKIIYPTKGYVTYDYEPHGFGYNNSGYLQGGIRIKDIKDYTNNGVLSMHKTYLYQLGNVGGALPSVAVPTSSGSYFRFDQNQAFLGGSNGSYVGYQIVDEVSLGPNVNATKTYYYSSDTDIEGSFTVHTNTCNDLSNLTGIRQTTFFPFFEMESRSERRGILLKEAFYKNPLHDQSDTPIKEIKYNYSLQSNVITSVNSSYLFWDINDNLKVKLSGTRNLRQEKMVLDSKREIDYISPVDSIVKMTDITYTTGDYAGKFVKSITTSTEHPTGSPTRIESTLYKYPFDYTSTASGGVLSNMVAMNYINPVISEINTNNTAYYTGAKVFNYMSLEGDPNRPVPKDVFLLNLQPPLDINATTTGQINIPDPSNPGIRYEKRIEYKKYDGFANPVSIWRDGALDILNWTLFDQLMFKATSVPANYDAFLFPPQSWYKITDANAKKGNSVYVWDGYPAAFPFVMNGGEPTVISFWAKGGAFLIEAVPGGQIDNITINQSVPNEWKFYSFSLPTYSQDWYNGSVYLTGTAKIDEVIISNGEGPHVRYNYEKRDLLQSISDNNGKIHSFEYDPFSRLKYEKDVNGNIIKSYDYHFKP